jgi:glycine cleavage system H protein
MNYPEKLRYSKEHEWIDASQDPAVVGITWFAQDALGDVVFVDLPAVGAELKQGQEFGVVESVKTVSNLYSPVSGKVVEINQELGKHPEFINEAPHDKGWIIKIKPSNPEELKNLLSNKDYEAQIQKKS